jgi:N-acetylmuramoyl-L-alanine amidase
LLAAAAVAAVIYVAETRTTSLSAPSAGGTAIDPGQFSPGACVAFAPTAGDRHLTVFLDAGHGGIDPGAVGTTESGATIYEADETLPVELDTMALLRADGFTVVVSRTGATSVVRLRSADVDGTELTLVGAHDDVAARALCANEAHAAVLVGIYFDAGATAQNAGSVTAYDPDRPFWRKSERLAALIQRDVVGAMDAKGWAIPNIGAQSDAGLGSEVPTAPGTGGSLAADAASYNHLLLLGPAMAGFFSTPSEMPGAVIEPLFITDPFEGSIAASRSGQEVIAHGIAKAVEQYLDDSVPQ